MERVLLPEVECIKSKKKKKKMMMPGEAGGPPGYLALSTTRAHSKMPT